MLVCAITSCHFVITNVCDRELVTSNPSVVQITHKA